MIAFIIAASLAGACSGPAFSNAELADLRRIVSGPSAAAENNADLVAACPGGTCVVASGIQMLDGEPIESVTSIHCAGGDCYVEIVQTTRLGHRNAFDEAACLAGDIGPVILEARTSSDYQPGMVFKDTGGQAGLDTLAIRLLPKIDANGVARHAPTAAADIPEEPFEVPWVGLGVVGVVIAAVGVGAFVFLTPSRSVSISTTLPPARP